MVEPTPMLPSSIILILVTLFILNLKSVLTPEVDEEFIIPLLPPGLRRLRVPFPPVAASMLTVDAPPDTALKLNVLAPPLGAKLRVLDIGDEILILFPNTT